MAVTGFCSFQLHRLKKIGGWSEIANIVIFLQRVQLLTLTFNHLKANTSWNVEHFVREVDFVHAKL